MSLVDGTGAGTAGASDQNGTPPPAGDNQGAGAGGGQGGDGGSPTGWFYDDGKPGDGDSPEWLKKDKYKSVADQAKAYGELEKRMGAFKGAPDDYDLTLSDMPDIKFEKEDPFMQEFLADAKANNVSQEYVSNLLKTYVKMQKANSPDPDKELEKLGANAKHDIQILAQWGQNVLSKEEFTTFKNMMTTAESVRIFEKLRAIATNPDTQPKNPNIPQENEADVRKLIHDERFETDENFRNSVREKLKRFGA